MLLGVTDAGTFLLGVGCQKGGTAWMHRYLEASPQCDPGFRKEYHVWDALDLPVGAAGTRADREARAGSGPGSSDDPSGTSTTSPACWCRRASG